MYLTEHLPASNYEEGMDPLGNSNTASDNLLPTIKSVKQTHGFGSVSNS
jgi:hypothetical protein